MNKVRIACVACLSIGLLACGSGGPGAPATPAMVTLAFAPDPVRAAPCPPGSCGPLLGEMEAVGTVTVRESAGVAATVESITMELRLGNATVQRGEFTAAAVTQLAGGTRVGAGASLAIPVAMHFTPAAGVLPAQWMVTVVLNDDRGNRLTPAVSVAVL